MSLVSTPPPPTDREVAEEFEKPQPQYVQIYRMEGLNRLRFGESRNLEKYAVDFGNPHKSKNSSINTLSSSRNTAKNPSRNDRKFAIGFRFEASFVDYTEEDKRITAFWDQVRLIMRDAPQPKLWQDLAYSGLPMAAILYDIGKPGALKFEMLAGASPKKIRTDHQGQAVLQPNVTVPAEAHSDHTGSVDFYLEGNLIYEFFAKGIFSADAKTGIGYGKTSAKNNMLIGLPGALTKIEANFKGEWTPAYVLAGDIGIDLPIKALQLEIGAGYRWWDVKGKTFVNESLNGLSVNSSSYPDKSNRSAGFINLTLRYYFK